MATAFLSPIFSASTHIQPVTSENCESIIRNGLPKSTFLFGNSDFAASTTLCSSSLQGKAAVSRKFKICAYKSSFDHIPKQFRQENLKDGGRPWILARNQRLRISAELNRNFWAIFNCRL